MLGTVADAEDLVQETFLRWQACNHETIESPKAWLSTVDCRKKKLCSVIVRRVAPQITDCFVAVRTDAQARPRLFYRRGGAATRRLRHPPPKGLPVYFSQTPLDRMVAAGNAITAFITNR